MHVRRYIITIKTLIQLKIAVTQKYSNMIILNSNKFCLCHTPEGKMPKVIQVMCDSISDQWGKSITTEQVNVLISLGAQNERCSEHHLQTHALVTPYKVSDGICNNLCPWVLIQQTWVPPVQVMVNGVCPKQGSLEMITYCYTHNPTHTSSEVLTHWGLSKMTKDLHFQKHYLE